MVQGEPHPFLSEALGGMIQLAQARLGPPQEPASVSGASELPRGSWPHLPARPAHPAQRQPAQESRQKEGAQKGWVLCAGKRGPEAPQCTRVYIASKHVAD